MDDNFVVNFDRTKNLIGNFKDKFPDFIWQIVDMRVDYISNSFFDYIKNKGCEFVGFGVESIHSSSPILTDEVFAITLIESPLSEMYRVFHKNIKRFLTISYCPSAMNPKHEKSVSLAQTLLYP